MADKKISELTNVSGLNLTDLFVLSQIFGNDWVSKNVTLLQLANSINNGIDYTTDLQTTSKKPIGAINENKSGIDTLRDFIQSQLPVNTASGSIATFSTSLALPLVAMSAEIVAQQAGSGTPSPTNVRNISGFDEVEIKHCGKNLFDPTISSNINTVITIWGLSDINIVAFFNKLPVGNYKFSFKIRVDAINGSSAYKYGIILANSSSGNITMRNDETNVEVGSIFERSANVNITNSNKGLFTNFWFYCGRSIAEGTDKCTFYDFQLELGNTQTTYEPYNGETKTIALGQTVYGGSVDCIGGSASKTFEIIEFDGSEDENWSYLSSGYIIERPTNAKTSNDSTPLCNMAQLTTSSNVPDGYFRIGNSYIVIRLGTGDSDVSTFKQFLSNNHLIIAYEMVTPTEITGLTPANFTTFAGEQNIFADCGDVSVSFKQGIQEYIDAKIAETQALILNS